jgi:hypothetical protein
VLSVGALSQRKISAPWGLRPQCCGALACSAGDEVDRASLTALLEFVARLVLGIVRVLEFVATLEFGSTLCGTEYVSLLEPPSSAGNYPPTSGMSNSAVTEYRLGTLLGTLASAIPMSRKLPGTTGPRGLRLCFQRSDCHHRGLTLQQRNVCHHRVRNASQTHATQSRASQAGLGANKQHTTEQASCTARSSPTIHCVLVRVSSCAAAVICTR